MADHIMAIATPQPSSGLRGEGRFTVQDSRAGPGEPLLRSRFPYSFYVLRLLQDLKNDARNGARGGSAATPVPAEESLRRQFAMLRLGDRLHGTLSRATTASNGNDFEGSNDEDDEVLLTRYAHDFAGMLLPSVRQVSRSDQALYLLALLDIAGPGSDDEHGAQLDAQAPCEGLAGWMPVRSLAALHHRFWMQEHAVRLHFKLLDTAGPAAFELALGSLRSRLYEVQRGSQLGGLLPDLHVLVIRAAQVALRDTDIWIERSLQAGPGPLSESIAAWASHVGVADRVVENMMTFLVGSRVGLENSLGDDHGEKQNGLQKLPEGWAKLRLMKKLVRRVTAPLALPPQDALSALSTLRDNPHPLRSKEFLAAVVVTLYSAAIHPQLCIDVLGTPSPRPDKEWEVFPRFLEGYLAETVLDNTAREDGPVGSLRREADTVDVCEALVAVLSGDASYFIEQWGETSLDNATEISGVLAKIWPREAACVQGIRWLRALSSDGGFGAAEAIDDCLKAGLSSACRRAGGSCDNMLAACFAVAVEESTTIDEASFSTQAYVRHFVRSITFPALVCPGDDSSPTSATATSGVFGLRFVDERDEPLTNKECVPSTSCLPIHR